MQNLLNPLNPIECLLNPLKFSSFRAADEISNSDEVLVQRNDELTPANIIKISTFVMQGNHLTHNDRLFMVSLIIWDSSKIISECCPANVMLKYGMFVALGYLQ